jgi:hypothetical protein
MVDETPFKIANSIFAINSLDRETNYNFPLDMRQIHVAQLKDEALQEHLSLEKFKKNITTMNINRNNVTTFIGKVWVPKQLQQWILKWYHSNLQHAGVTHTINTIGQTFVWKGLPTMVEKHIETCNSCQHNKQSNKKAYGKMLLV